MEGPWLKREKTTERNRKGEKSSQEVKNLRGRKKRGFRKIGTRVVRNTGGRHRCEGNSGRAARNQVKKKKFSGTLDGRHRVEKRPLGGGDATKQARRKKNFGKTSADNPRDGEETETAAPK